MSRLTPHQKKQIEVINRIEQKVKEGKVSIVPPVKNFEDDPRICLTSVHFPENSLIREIKRKIITPLKKVAPDIYYYKPTSLHMTIKNVQVINDPPTFSREDVNKVKKVFSVIIPKHKQFNVYFYRILLLPHSLSLMGTTDPELDNIFLSLDRSLNKIEIPDNKKYANKKYFIINITLARFNKPLTGKVKSTVANLSRNLSFKPYKVSSVTLIVANASLNKCERIDTWNLYT